MNIEEDIARELARLHAENLEDWERRTVAANKERGNGIMPGPNDKPQTKEPKR